MTSTVSLVECFSVIRDPRQESKIDHELIDILVLLDIKVCIVTMVASEQYIDGKTTSETRYFIASIASSAKIFANAVRKH